MGGGGAGRAVGTKACSDGDSEGLWPAVVLLGGSVVSRGLCRPQTRALLEEQPRGWSLSLCVGGGGV